MLSDHHPTLTLDEKNDESIEKYFLLLKNCNPSITENALRHAAAFVHFALMQKDSAQVKIYLELAQQICELDLRAARLLGYYYLQDKQYPQALVLFNRFIENYDDDNSDIGMNEAASCFFYRGSCHFQTNNHHAAREDFLLGMAADLQGDCLGEYTKEIISQHIAELEILQLTNKGLIPDNQDHHLQTAKQLQAQQDYKNSLYHLDQAILATPLKAELYLMRSDLYQQLMVDSGDTASLGEATRNRMLAAWLNIAKIDETSTFDGKTVRNEAHQLFAKYEESQAETKTLQNKAQRLHAATIQTEEKKKIGQTQADLTPTIEKVREYLPDIPNNNFLTITAKAVFNLHQGNTDGITLAECQEILDLLKTPSEMPDAYLKALDNRLKKLTRQKNYYQAVVVLDQAISHYPRIHALYVQRAKFFMMQSIIKTNRDQPFNDLNFALWLHRSRLDKHVPSLIPYHEQKRAFYLCNGECEKSLQEHKMILALLPENKKAAANKEYVSVIHDLFRVNPHLKREAPEGVLKWLNLSYLIIPDPKVKEKITELETQLYSSASSAASSAPKKQKKKAKAPELGSAAQPTSDAGSAPASSIQTEPEKEEPESSTKADVKQLQPEELTSHAEQVEQPSSIETKAETATSSSQISIPAEEERPTLAEIQKLIEQQEAKDQSEWEQVDTKAHIRQLKENKKAAQLEASKLAEQQHRASLKRMVRSKKTRAAATAQSGNTNPQHIALPSTSLPQTEPFSAVISHNPIMPISPRGASPSIATQPKTPTLLATQSAAENTEKTEPPHSFENVAATPNTSSFVSDETVAPITAEAQDDALMPSDSQLPLNTDTHLQKDENESDHTHNAAPASSSETFSNSSSGTSHAASPSQKEANEIYPPASTNNSEAITIRSFSDTSTETMSTIAPSLSIHIDPETSGEQIASPVPLEKTNVSQKTGIALEEKTIETHPYVYNDLELNLLTLLQAQQQAIGESQTKIHQQEMVISEQKKQIDELAATKAMYESLYQTHLNNMQLQYLQYQMQYAETQSNAYYMQNPLTAMASYLPPQSYYPPMQAASQYSYPTFLQQPNSATLIGAPLQPPVASQPPMAPLLSHQNTLPLSANRHRFQPNQARRSHPPKPATAANNGTDNQNKFNRR
ncbi:MAG: hypothetical protein P4M14_03900 [Gammaproteobacteria bacterium]|nr:hypothetical protein [Gammaproteobacteria bacterium]